MAHRWENQMESVFIPFEEKFLRLKAFHPVNVEEQTIQLNEKRTLRLLVNRNFDKEENLLPSVERIWLQKGILKDFEVAALQYKGEDKFSKIKQYFNVKEIHNGIQKGALKFIYQLENVSQIVYLSCETVFVFPELQIDYIRYPLRPLIKEINILYEEDNLEVLLNAEATEEANNYQVNEIEEHVTLFQEAQMILEAYLQKEVRSCNIIRLYTGEKENENPIPWMEWKKGTHGIRSVL